MAVLPIQTRTIDDDWANTWQEIREDVIDNVLEATIFWLALKEFGCLTPQVGGNNIERTIGYGTKSTQRFVDGTVFTQSIPKLDTAATWNWRYFTVDLNRSLVKDAINAGKYQIKSYLTRQIEAARNALVQDMESFLMRWTAYYQSTEPPQPNGLYDICPLYTAESAVGSGSASDSQASGTSNGGIDRTNAWWRNWVMYSGATETKSTFIAGPTNAPYDLNLVPDMRHAYNSVTAGVEPPDFIITNQSMYESYEDEAADKSQIVMNGFTKKAVDLGFDAFTFKGATMTYSSKQEQLHMHMLNMKKIECVYDPNVWFDMTEWMNTANQFERVAYIVCMTTGLLTAEPRRHLAMEYAS